MMTSLCIWNLLVIMMKCTNYLKLSKKFLEVFPEDFAKHDIRPTVLLDLINDKSGEFRNVVVGK